jgi:hypothetical protein
MNERIKELALQAGYERDMFGIGHWDMLECEKFALLIVQDCIDIISPYTVRMGRPGEEYLHPIQEIKRHFDIDSND